MSSAKPRVLIVDDMTDARTLLRLLLTHRGHYEVMEAQTGMEALEQTRVQQPDLIILDYMMPDLDGGEVCRILRREAATTDIPIVMLTARTDQRTHDEALAAGVNVYLTKPIKTEELLAATERLLTAYSETSVGAD